MQAEGIINKLKEKFNDSIEKEELNVLQPYIIVKKESFKEIMEYLYKEEELAFDYLMCLSGVDWKEHLEVVYHLYSFKHRHKIVIKVKLQKEEPKIASVSSIWKTANWHEREAYDLFGIIFENHPDLRRILLPEDWEGHPLRKDYIFPKEYRGIDLT